MGIIGWVIVIYIIYIVANIVYDLYLKKNENTASEEEIIPLSMEFEAPADAGAIILYESKLKEEEDRREEEKRRAEKLKIEEDIRLRKEREEKEDQEKLQESLISIQKQKKIEEATLLAEQKQASEIATSSSVEYLKNVTIHGGYNIESMKDIVRNCQDNTNNNPLFGIKMLK